MNVFPLSKSSAGDNTRKHRVLKGASIVLLIVVVAVLLCEWAGWPFLRQPLQNQLATTLQRPVVIGDEFQLRLLGSIRGQANELRIGPTQAVDNKTPPDLLQANDIKLAIPYSTLWKFNKPTPDDPPRIKLLDVAYMKVHLERDATGKSNWSTTNTENEQDNQESVIPTFDRLVVQKSDIHMDDAKGNVKFDAQVTTTEGNGETGGLNINAKGEYHDQPLTVEIQSSGIMPLMASPEPSTKVPLSFRATARNSEFTFKGEAIDVLSLNGVSGHVSLKGPSLSTVGDIFEITLPTTSEFWLRGNLQRNGKEWAMQDVRLNAGKSRLSGAFVYDQRPEIPMLKGELNGSPLYLADLAPAFGAPPNADDENEEANTDPNARTLPQREFDIPSLHRMNAQVKLRLKKVDLGNAFDRPFQPLDGDLVLENGVFKIQNLLARTADGELRGALSLDSTPKVPEWKFDLQWAHINLEKWLAPKNRAADAGVDEKPQGFLSGELHGSAALAGKGDSTAAMLGSLNGSLNLWVKRGEISQLLIEAMGLDIAEALGVVVQGDEKLTMQCAIIAMNAQQGVLKPEAAIIDTRDTTVFAQGDISLAQEKLNLTITAKPKDKSPVTLRSPIMVQGTFASPQVDLQKRKVGLKLLGAAVMSALAPIAAIIPLIDMGDEEEAGGCKQAINRLKENDEQEAKQQPQ